MTQSDIIQQLNGGVLIRTIINSSFSTTDIFTALRENGLATLWGYIQAEVSPISTILDYYQSNYTTEFVNKCVIVLLRLSIHI
jgi:hypothetical protein